MSLSQYIRDNTNDGHLIARVLIDVLEGRLDGTKIGHRLTAARLLTIYGHEDADDFIADNTPEVSDKEWEDRVLVTIDPAISECIRERTEGGRELCIFLIDVVKGEVEGNHVGHRVWAARELLNRAFGKSQSRPLPKPQSSNRHSRANGNPRGRGEVLTPHSSPLTPKEAPAASAVVLEEPEQQSDYEIDPRIDVARDIDYWLDIYDTPRYEFMEECQHPDFDPYVATIDEEYFKSFTACHDPDCEVHGSPPGDPDAQHY